MIAEQSKVESKQCKLCSGSWMSKLGQCLNPRVKQLDKSKCKFRSN